MTVSADHWYSHWSCHHHWNGALVCYYTSHTWHDWNGMGIGTGDGIDIADRSNI